MRRVLQMTGLNRGGLETFVMNVYRKIDRNKIQFDFLTETPDGDYAEEIRSMGGRIFPIRPRNKGFVAYYRALDSFFAGHSNEYCAVHQHISSLSLASSLYYARKYGIRTRVLHSHSSSISANKLHYLLHYSTKLFVPYLATDYFGCSDKALDWMFNGTGVRSKAKMINNGIDVNLFRYNDEKRHVVRKELGIDGCHVLGHVGRFSTVKNHRFLINIFHNYHQNHPNSKLLLVGNGGLMDDVRKQVKDLQLADDVLFLGVRTDIPDLLQAMDIFVMPSLFEGLPVSLVEAQCTGLPVLVTDVVSHDTEMTEAFHYMSLENSAEEWADEINTILSSYRRRDNSEAIARHGFDINTTVSELSQLYLGGDY